MRVRSDSTSSSSSSSSSSTSSSSSSSSGSSSEDSIRGRHLEDLAFFGGHRHPRGHNHHKWGPRHHHGPHHHGPHHHGPHHHDYHHHMRGHHHMKGPHHMKGRHHMKRMRSICKQFFPEGNLPFPTNGPEQQVSANPGEQQIDNVENRMESLEINTDDHRQEHLRRKLGKKLDKKQRREMKKMTKIQKKYTILLSSNGDRALMRQKYEVLKLQRKINKFDSKIEKLEKKRDKHLNLLSFCMDQIATVPSNGNSSQPEPPTAPVEDAVMVQA